MLRDTRCTPEHASDLEGLALPPLPGDPGSHARRPAKLGCCSPKPGPVLPALLSRANGRTKWPGPMAAAKVARAIEPIKVQLYVSPALETPGAGLSAKSANQWPINKKLPRSKGKGWDLREE